MKTIAPRQDQGIPGVYALLLLDVISRWGYNDESLFKSFGLSTEQLEIITAIGKGKQHIDDIIEATGYPAAKVLAQLTVLEIKGYISRSAGKRISLNIKR